MSETRRWLDARHPRPPAALAERMAEALAASPGVDEGGEAGGGATAARAAEEAAPGAASAAPAAGPGIAGSLAEAAIDRLRIVLAADGRDDAALDLLAADALLTYAGEAAAEAGPRALEALVTEFGPARLASLLPDAAEES